jgi:hypothetical protein
MCILPLAIIISACIIHGRHRLMVHDVFRPLRLEINSEKSGDKTA